MNYKSRFKALTTAKKLNTKETFQFVHIVQKNKYGTFDIIKEPIDLLILKESLKRDRGLLRGFSSSYKEKYAR